MKCDELPRHFVGQAQTEAQSIEYLWHYTNLKSILKSYRIVVATNISESLEAGLYILELCQARKEPEKTRKRLKVRLARPTQQLARRRPKTERLKWLSLQSGMKDQRTTVKGKFLHTMASHSVKLPYAFLDDQYFKPFPGYVFCPRVSNLFREAAAAKAAEAARKKAEKAALEAEEAASLKSAKTGNAKSAQKKSSAPAKKLDLSQLDEPGETPKAHALNASNIDDALDALAIGSGKQEALDRHPERRFKAAYTVYEERRLDEMKDEKGLRRNQKIERIKKEFEKHPDNPFNQVSAQYNATKDELDRIKQEEKEKTERRLTGN
jgi:hypothetical protein